MPSTVDDILSDAGSGLFYNSGQSLGNRWSDAVAMGDMDADGDLDAFVGNWFVGRDQLYLNDGAGAFSNSGQQLPAEDTLDVALADVDNDGDLDTISVGSRNYIYHNDGNGTLTWSGQDLATDLAGAAVATADLNGDSNEDIVVGTGSGSKIFLNSGGGVFVDSGQTLGGARTFGLALGDLDADGDLDLFAGNYDDAADRVWLNDGSGTFVDSGQTLGNADTYAVDLGDVDGDGDLDAFVANINGADTVWLNDGAGTFSDSQQTLAGPGSYSGALADLDADGDLDLLIATRDANTVWFNDGAGLFVDSGQQLVGDVSQGLDVGDLDADGDVDAFVANVGQASGAPNQVWFNRSRTDLSVQKSAAAEFIVPGEPFTSFITVTNNGPDAGTTTFLTDTLPPGVSFEAVFPSTYPCSEQNQLVTCDVGPLDVGQIATVTIRAATPVTLAGALTNTAGASTLDLDATPSNNRAQATATIVDVPITGLSAVNDGPTGLGRPTTLSATTATGNGVTYAWAFGDGTQGGGPVVTHTYGATGAYTAVVTATNAISTVSATTLVRIGEDLTVVAAHPLTNSIAASTAATLSATLSTDVPPGAVSSRTLRVAGAQSGLLAGDLTYASARRTLLFTPEQPFKTGELLQATVASPLSTSVGVPLTPFNWHFITAVSAGNGRFSDSMQALSAASDIALADLDGDGDLDVFLILTGSGARVWLNNGRGILTDSGQLFGTTWARNVALGDVDADGDLDAFLAGYNSNPDNRPNELWLNDGTGRFVDSGQRPGPAASYAAALGDLDGDGDLDAYVAGYSYDGSPHTVWFNDGRGTFHDSGQTLGSHRSQDVALGDVDGDGDLDAVVADQYENDDNVWFNDGTGHFHESSQQLVSGYGSLSVALGDLNGDRFIDIFFAKYRRNRVWLNDGTGHFTRVQSMGSSRSNGVALGDVDADGDLDAYVANHAYLGRSAVNRLWLNDGTGHFNDSGQTLRQANSNAVALGDLDGDGDLDSAVANGDGGPSRIWWNAYTADLVIDKEQGAQRRAITYSLAFTNDGPSAAAGVHITDLLPANFTLHSVTSSVPLTPANGAHLGWRVGYLPAGSGGQITVSGALSDDRVATNQVQIESPVPDDDWDNNTAAVTYNVADLTLNLTQRPAGAALTYTLTFTNEGPDVAYNVVLTQLLPSALLTPTWHHSGAAVTLTQEAPLRWQIAPLAPGDGGLITTTGAISGLGSLHTRAAITSTLLDPAPASNRAALVYNDLHVAAISPLANSTAAVTVPVVVTFSRPISSATVHTRTFTARGSLGGAYQGAYHAAESTAVFTPSAPFMPGETVVVNLGDGVATREGPVRLQPFAWQFNAAADGGYALFAEGDRGDNGSYAWDATLGDVDGDGDLDGIVLNEYRSASEVWLNDGRGDFIDSGQRLPTINPESVALGDVDGDFDLDALVASSFAPNQLFLNDGQGAFSDSGQSIGNLTDTFSADVALGDVDSDGDLDALVLFSGAADELWLNDGQGVFSDSGQRLGAEWSASVSLGDLDADGDLDAVVGNAASGLNRVWRNDGHGRFYDDGQRLGDIYGHDSYGVALGDVDGDGDLDLLEANRYNDPDKVWLNDGDGYFVDSGQRLGNAGSEAATLGDLDGDGDLDAFLAYTSYDVDDATPVWLNDGSGHFTPGAQALSGAASRGLALGDVDADGDLDAFLARAQSAGHAVYLNQPLALTKRGPSAVAAGQPITYHLTITNLNTITYTNVVVTDAVPPGSHYVSGGDLGEGGVVSWTLPQLNPGAGAHLTFAVTATANLTNSSYGASTAGGVIIRGYHPVHTEVDNPFGALDAANDSPTPLGSATTLTATVAGGSNPHFRWAFGDGTAGAGAIAHHVYPEVGVYTATVMVTNSLDALTATTRVTITEAPISRLQAVNSSPTLLGRPTELQADVTGGSSVSYTWALGDNTYGAGQVITHVYPAIGDYTAVVTAHNAVNSVTATTQITIFEIPISGLLATNDSPTVLGRTTLLTAGVAGGSNVSFTWAFGDNTYGAGQVITHVYPAIGVYTATVTATNAVSQATAATTVWISPALRVLDVYPPSAAYTVATTTPVSATLSRDVDAGTVHSRTFVVQGHDTGRYTGSYTVATRTGYLRFDTASPFKAGEQIDVILSSGVRAPDGIALEPHAWRFRMGVSSSNAIFSSGGEILPNAESRDVELGDLDGDGDLDAFVTTLEGPEMVWLNDGAGHFADSGQRLGNVSSRGAALGDVDGDGDLDAVVAHLDIPSGSPNQVWLNDGQGAFSNSGLDLGASDSYDTLLGDVDGDGDLDALFVESGRNDLYLNDGHGYFAYSGQSLGRNYFTYGGALGDVDADGDLDVLIANSIGGVEIWQNDGKGVFHRQQTFHYADGNMTALLGDVDGDGDLDALIINYASYAPTWLWLNDGQGFFTLHQSLGLTYHQDGELADLDGDGDLDLYLVRQNRTDQVWLNDGSGTFSNSGQSLSAAHAEGMALGDVDSDGDLDAFIAVDSSGSNTVWFNVGNEATEISGLQAQNNGPTLIGESTLLLAEVERGSPVTYTWSLGDGNVVAGQVVTHTYALPGTYTAVVTASNSLNFVTATTQVLINAPPTAADDLAEVNMNDAVMIAILDNDYDPDGHPLAVESATGASHGTVSVNADQTITYEPDLGYCGPDGFTYTITDGYGGVDEANVTVEVTCVSSVSAAFTGTPLTGVVPLTVTFYNLSTGDYDTCNWTFGDGGTSGSCDDPQYTYTRSGNYTVTLTITGPGGSDSESKTDYVIVEDAGIDDDYRFYLPAILRGMPPATAPPSPATPFPGNATNQTPHPPDEPPLRTTVSGKRPSPTHPPPAAAATTPPPPS